MIENGIVLAVFTDGRRDCILRTIDSFDDHVHGELSRRLIFDDSGDPAYGAWLEEKFPGYAVLSSGQRRGFAGNIARAWDILAGAPERWIFHLEDDFTFRRDVYLSWLTAAMQLNPQLVQIALVRQACNPQERAAGGMIEGAEERGYQFDRRSFDNEVEWLEHRAFFTTNPSIYPVSLTRYGWPIEAESEGKFGIRLLQDDPLIRFAFWGDGTEWVEHIGLERVGTGY